MSNKAVSVSDLDTLLQSANPPLVIDVRKLPALEQDPDMLPGAVWQVHDTVDEWAKDITRESRVIVYCVHGHEVSQDAALALQKMGFDASYLEGGFHDWKQAGMMVQKDGSQ